jgi:hypothetical protein
MTNEINDDTKLHSVAIHMFDRLPNFAMFLVVRLIAETITPLQIICPN